jgi:hypothetical protein
MKRALIVGIDKYISMGGLSGCENDAVELAAMLARNGDGSPNFHVRLLTSDNEIVTAGILQDAITELFDGDADTALFFFAGHGYLDSKTRAGYIVSQDGDRGALGVTLADIVSQANVAYPKIRSTVIILDSCQSGAAGEPQLLGDTDVSQIGTGVTILTACRKNGVAEEEDGHGIFTKLLLEGLSGTASDVVGRITPASVYSLIDQTLGAWGQRPLYKANVQSFVTLREVPPKVPFSVIRDLPTYFPSPSSIYKLDPSCEPDRGEEAERLKDIPVDPHKVRAYRDMQNMNRFGLIVPVDQPHMWHAAVFSTGCKLTALGAHYRSLAANNRI